MFALFGNEVAIACVCMNYIFRQGPSAANVWQGDCARLGPMSATRNHADAERTALRPCCGWGHAPLLCITSGSGRAVSGALQGGEPHVHVLHLLRSAFPLRLGLLLPLCADAALPRKGNERRSG